MRLRPAVESDLPAVLALNEAAVPHVNSVTLDFLREHISPYLTVADVEGQIAGALVGMLPGLDYDSLNYRWFSARYPEFIYVDRVFVSDAFQRRGIARMLYDHFAGFGRSRGVPVMTCEVNIRPRNDASLVFHERMGFVPAGEQDTEGGEKRVVLLVRHLGRGGS